MITSSTDLEIQANDGWDLDAACCTEDTDTLFHVGGTIGDCSDHCVSLSVDDMTLNVEIKNERGGGAVYFVDVVPVEDQNDCLEIESPEYDGEPIPNDNSRKFKFYLSRTPDSPLDNDSPTVMTNLRIIVKYAGDAQDYQINKMDANLRLEPSVSV